MYASTHIIAHKQLTTDTHNVHKHTKRRTTDTHNIQKHTIVFTHKQLTTDTHNVHKHAIFFADYHGYAQCTQARISLHTNSLPQIRTMCTSTQLSLHTLRRCPLYGTSRSSCTPRFKLRWWSGRRWVRLLRYAACVVLRVSLHA